MPAKVEPAADGERAYEIHGEQELERKVAEAELLIFENEKTLSEEVRQTIMKEYPRATERHIRIMQGFLRKELARIGVRKIREMKKERRRRRVMLANDKKYQLFCDSRDIGSVQVLFCPLVPPHKRLYALMAKAALLFVLSVSFYFAYSDVTAFNFDNEEFITSITDERQIWFEKIGQDGLQYISHDEDSTVYYYTFPDHDFFLWNTKGIFADWERTMIQLDTIGLKFDAFKEYYDGNFETKGLHPNMGVDYFWGLYTDWEKLKSEYNKWKVDKQFIEELEKYPPVTVIEKRLDSKVDFTKMITMYNPYIWAGKIADYREGIGFYPLPPAKVYIEKEPVVIDDHDDYRDPISDLRGLEELNIVVPVFFVLYIVGVLLDGFNKMPLWVPRKWTRKKASPLRRAHSGWDGMALIYTQLVFETVEALFFVTVSVCVLLPYAIDLGYDIEMILNGVALLFIADMDENMCKWFLTRREAKIILTWHFTVLSSYPIDPKIDITFDDDIDEM